ncbi:hypothetical protein D9758_014410 [Tetrapyrgos nigripes]|uniref:UV excision repair protein RAD23 n=1 Tax=Tetrapyrgos nigripes TaxID=182062 RepID=A0A8H5CPT2_9AGAR|nr:hypothetical protein D9758_014410 [Tetrapyrgos nigripes]
MVEKNNGPSTVPSNPLIIPTPSTDTATISSTEPGSSTLVNQDNSPPTVPPNSQSMSTPLTNTATISSAGAGPSNSSVLVSSSVRPPSQSSAFNHAQTTPQTEPIVGAGSDGDQKVLATLEGSQVDDFGALKALGFSEQATFEAYLRDGNKERAASFLAENGNDSSSSSNSVFADNFKELIASLGEPDFDQIQQLEALGFPHDVALAAYLACNKNAQLAANVLVEHGADLNLDSGDEPTSAISNTPMALPSTSNPDSALTKTKTSENTATASSSMPSSPTTSFFAEVSSTSEPMTVDDSEFEDDFSSEGKATINKAKKMGFPSEAVIMANSQPVKVTVAPVVVSPRQTLPSTSNSTTIIAIPTSSGFLTSDVQTNRASATLPPPSIPPISYATAIIIGSVIGSIVGKIVVIPIAILYLFVVYRHGYYCEAKSRVEVQRTAWERVRANAREEEVDKVKEMELEKLTQPKGSRRLAI